ncbi:hypothetical protein Pyrfu_0097 [Pyrolobus fumarii 1A]|uniref:Proteasome assembly chaperone family protein n=1 Tax=Pyrolobus fumarii (strain DSM 11204 / 1A) TaxID=694429 RepID=G0EE53_PYRF1|nr:PAC2 family protein [Pyrolobus fumarii]AEM37969.1 hypothetical protein Pyrfu_0097 [Pyrolobus fumarii 1A]
MAELVFAHRRVRVYAIDPGALSEAARDGVLITGFRGFGAVGYITTTHLVEKLRLQRLGYIVTRYMPEFVTRGADGGIVAPFEIYGSVERRLLVLVNHDVPVERERDAYAEAVVLFAKKMGVSRGVFIGGFDARFRRGEERFRWLASGGYQGEFSEPTIDKDLFVVGPLALLILYSEIHRFPAVTILPYTETARPDPAAAAVAVEVVARLLNLEVDVSELLEMARKIEEVIERVEHQREAATAPSGASDRLYT